MTVFEFFKANYEAVTKRNAQKVDLINMITSHEIGSYKWFVELDENVCFSNVEAKELFVKVDPQEVENLIDSKVLKNVVYKDGYHRSVGKQSYISFTARGFKKFYKSMF